MAQRLNLCPQCRRHGFDPWAGKIPWQPTPLFLPGESYGWRSLVGYSPQGRKEWETTERLHFHFQVFSRIRIVGLYTGVFITLPYLLKLVKQMFRESESLSVSADSAPTLYSPWNSPGQNWLNRCSKKGSANIRIWQFTSLKAVKLSTYTSQGKKLK